MKQRDRQQHTNLHAKCGKKFFDKELKNTVLQIKTQYFPHSNTGFWHGKYYLVNITKEFSKEMG